MTELLPSWFWESDPFTRVADRSERLLEVLNRQTAHHSERCVEYARMVKAMHPDGFGAGSLADVPYLPVGVFKRLRLMSISEEEIYRVLRSSGTTGRDTSYIVLDGETARLQSRALARIATSLLGATRPPMLVVDAPLSATMASISARRAAVLGFMPFGRDHFFALNEALAPDESGLASWLSRRNTTGIFIFEFTFLVWKWMTEGTSPLRLAESVMIHGGGWKKLQDLAVSTQEFRAVARERLGINRVHDYYGFVEQTGSIHIECECGFLHTPIFADVIVRDPQTRQPVPDGTAGLIQTVSVLPWSYPGHSILTEDIGVIEGRDDCECGRGGTRFRVVGRVPRAILRGCSDTLVA